MLVYSVSHHRANNTNDDDGQRGRKAGDEATRDVEWVHNILINQNIHKFISCDLMNEKVISRCSTMWEWVGKCCPVVHHVIGMSVSWMFGFTHKMYEVCLCLWVYLLFICRRVYVGKLCARQTSSRMDITTLLSFLCHRSFHGRIFPVTVTWQTPSMRMWMKTISHRLAQAWA